ncbi:hypothetical protein A2662_00510 [Candidatus Giovannonibacteria bacterium RIFCSPHIGHO2_01_FULL_45_33]|uniref:Uncharacterized protein n=1 Tax=Candidatus Giovannonibacteria bacterium RIFCSPLOWO2_01_FULL_45_34 TaxID=1798351 RepID=A0A1F5WYT3_9BACT|nr:MAG: hypothetical protein A2662_00510 [Candidatus Giovannonibacteria bacterium RIFCSPHIGHO2_01_FULL_45_33]OGF80763.1 MAG: hypothetical protein A2930_02445 [Candidatus Giovannonibacteria bacterium RIFCSPLOWO2_01_FULL_45_34]
MKLPKIFLLVLGLSLILGSSWLLSVSSASSSDNLSGWAFSDMPDEKDSAIAGPGNTGKGAYWISFNSTNQGAGANYGVRVDPACTTNVCNISGYAWANPNDGTIENIGWISFNAADVGGCPSGQCQPTLDRTTGVVDGWAKALWADGDGWDGWIHLKGPTYGVTVSGCNWSGWAWGENVLGWIHFRSGSDYGVVGTDNACVGGPTISCSLPSQAGRTIIDFVPYSYLRASSPYSAGPFGVSISAGKYNITLVSYDHHLGPGGSGSQSQPDEKYFIKLLNSSGGLIASTNSSAEIPNDQDYVTTLVNSSFDVTQNIASIETWHTAYPFDPVLMASDPDFYASSLTPVCAAFDDLTPPPVCISGDTRPCTAIVLTQSCPGTEACISNNWSGVCDDIPADGCPVIQICNNGIREGTEICDDPAGNGACPLNCNSTCTAFNSCPICGDGVVNQSSEECDTTDLSGETCISLGYSRGTLSCTSSCKFDRKECLSITEI